MAYTPISEDELHNYGELPEISGNSIIYELSDAKIPPNAREILVYLWATTQSDEEFHRYYYKIQTTDGTRSFTQYMNVAASKDVSLNSANLWLPVFSGYGQVTVQLIDAENPGAKGKSIACRRQTKCQKVGEKVPIFSEFFILGYSY